MLRVACLPRQFDSTARHARVFAKSSQYCVMGGPDIDGSALASPTRRPRTDFGYWRARRLPGLTHRREATGSDARFDA
jgi:hypothetical protein